MKIEKVEIYSDQSNLAVMKHPGRSFPGSLIQGDSLYNLCKMADEVCSEIKNKNLENAFDEANELKNLLWERLNQYKTVLGEHEISLPFYEI